MFIPKRDHSSEARDDPHQEHSHGLEHSHHHGRDLLGWLRRTYAHSHDTAERVDTAMVTSERGILALKVSHFRLGAAAHF